MNEYGWNAGDLLDISSHFHNDGNEERRVAPRFVVVPYEVPPAARPPSFPKPLSYDGLAGSTLGQFLFVIRNAKHSAANFGLSSLTMPSTMRGERSGSGRLPELRR